MKFRRKVSLSVLCAVMIALSNVQGGIVNASEINTKELKSEVFHINEKINNTESFESYSASNINTSSKIHKAKLDIQLSDFKILSNGDVNAKISLNDNENIKLDGVFLKNDDKNTYYGDIKSDNQNYEILHFSITRPGEESPISKKYSKNAVLNIYIKDVEKDRISFFEIDIDNNIINKVDNIKDKLNDASIEHVYWFTNTFEPEAHMEEIEEPVKEKAKVLKTVTLNPTLTWTYNDGSKVMNVESKFNIPTKITQSGYRVITEFKVSNHTLKENGVPIKSVGQTIKSLKVMLGSNTKILYLDKVGANGKYTTSQSPFYVNFDSSVSIGPGVSIGLRPLYNSSNYKNTLMVPINAYRLAFEAKKDSSYFELSQPGHYLTTSSLMANPYIGKNFSAQYSFEFKQGVHSKTFTYNSSSMHATLQNGTN